MIDNLLLGLSVVFSIKGFFFLFAGCLLGTIIGVLPGIGTVSTLALLFPYLYNIDPAYSIIMMAGIYYGAQYGGSTTSILINTPGEASSLMTCIDGYQMTQQGRGGQAVVASGIASLIAGLLTLLIIGLLSPLVAELAFEFGPRELCLLMLLGLLSISIITHKNFIAGVGVACIGILLGSIGTDINSGAVRFTGDNVYLIDGINIPVIAIGIFGVAEIFRNLFAKENNKVEHSLEINFGWNQFKQIIPSSLRGTAVGSFFGMIPGGGAIMASFAAYTLEKKASKNRDKIGKGAIEGVAAPEAANNAASQVGFIPLLTLGIPENAVMALMLGMLVAAGITPGPGMIEHNPQIFWGLLVSMFFGNLILAFLNIPLVKIWLVFLQIPKRILYPLLLVVALTGVYYINNSLFEVGLTLVFGLFGLLLSKLDLEPAPLMFGFIIGPMFEEYLRRSLIISRGDFSYFISSSTSVGLLTTILVITLFGIYKLLKNDETYC
jgi:TctA family transporter